MHLLYLQSPTERNTDLLQKPYRCVFCAHWRDLPLLSVGLTQHLRPVCTCYTCFIRAYFVHVGKAFTAFVYERLPNTCIQYSFRINHFPEQRSSVA